jgi:CDP-paratose synthetase
MKTILITGINGFLGSHLARTLYSKFNIVGIEYTLKDLYRIRDLNFKVYSVENGIPEQLFEENKIDIIIHTATFYGRNGEYLREVLRSNLYFPTELLDRAITNGCKLFINTDTVLDRYISPYALSKRHFQEWLYLRRDEIKIINMKLEHFYGPGCSNANFIISMIEALKRNESTIDLTAGDQKRDFVYIDDVVSAYITVINNTYKIKEQYFEFQVATGRLISIRDLMIYLKEITGSSSDLNFGALSYRQNEIMCSDSDNKSLVDLGWRHKYSLEEGLKITSTKKN